MFFAYSDKNKEISRLIATRYHSPVDFVLGETTSSTTVATEVTT